MPAEPPASHHRCHCLRVALACFAFQVPDALEGLFTTDEVPGHSQRFTARCLARRAMPRMPAAQPRITRALSDFVLFTQTRLIPATASHGGSLVAEQKDG